MKKCISLLLIAISAILAGCAEAPQGAMDDIAADILLEQNPDKGVLAVRMQGELYSKENPEIACNPTENEYLQIVCDAQAACNDLSGGKKLTCIYDEMKLPINQYERDMKSNEEKEAKVNQHHDPYAFGAWHDVREAHRELKQLVNSIREETLPGEPLSAPFAEATQQIYALFESLKEKYGVPNQIQIHSEIIQVEVLSSTGSWKTISSGPATLDLAIPDLNRLIALDALEPRTYTAIRLTFGDENSIVLNQRLNEPSAPDAWTTYPLLFAPEDTKTRTIFQDITLTRGVSSAIALNLDLRKSFQAEPDGVFIFKPRFNVMGIDSENQSRPDEPIDLVFNNGDLTVEADAGSIDKAIQITAKPLAEADLPAPPANQNGVFISAYEMKPDTVFNQAVKLSFAYDPDLLATQGVEPEGIRVRYYHEDRKQWIRIATYEVDTTANRVNVYTNHFTIIAIEGVNGFTLEYPGGISGRIQFDALNYIISKSVALNSTRDLHTETTSFPIEEGDIVAELKGTSFDYRDLRFSVQKRAGFAKQISINVSNVNSIFLGTLETYVNDIPGTICADLFNDCIGSCGHEWAAVEALCLGACALVAIPCYTAHGFGFEHRIHLDNLNFNINLLVKNDPKTGAFSVDLEGVEIKALKVDLVNIGSSIVKDTIKRLLTQYVEDYINDNVNLAQGIADDVSATMREELNESLADSLSEFGNFTLDQSGIAFQYDIDMEIDDPLQDLAGTGITENVSFSYNENQVDLLSADIVFSDCRTDINFGMPSDIPNGTLAMPSNVGIGLGFSLTAINQVITEMTNRGYFCLSASDSISQNSVYIQPTEVPTIEYLGNHIFKTNLGMKIIAVESNGRVHTGGGVVEFHYRLGVNIGGNELQMAMVKVLPHFADVDPLVTEGANFLVDKLNGHLSQNQNSYSARIHFANPLNYSGFQASTFKMAMLEEMNGMLAFGIEMRGLVLDPQHPDKEWVWTKNWSAGNHPCATITSGRVVTAASDYPTPHQYIQEGGETMALRNGSIDPVIFNSIIDTGESATLQGSCAGEFHVGQLHAIYVADNLVNDHFFMNANGGLLAKRNEAPQAIGDFENTLALYEVDISGDTRHEVLQAKMSSEGIYEINWILENTCCKGEPGEVGKYTMVLPDEYQQAGLYRVSVMERVGDFDQVLLNCKIYNVNVNPSASERVTLELADSICGDALAGVVIDESNALMWTKCSLGEDLYSEECAGEAISYLEPVSAESACSNLDVAGFGDWRLPHSHDYAALPQQNLAAPFFPEPLGSYWVSDHGYSVTPVIFYWPDGSLGAFTNCIEGNGCFSTEYSADLYKGSFMSYVNGLNTMIDTSFNIIIYDYFLIEDPYRFFFTSNQVSWPLPENYILANATNLSAQEMEAAVINRFGPFDSNPYKLRCIRDL